MKKIFLGLITSFFVGVSFANSDQELERTWDKGKVYVPGSFFSKRIERFTPEQKYPVVLYMHGCSGISSINDSRWAKFLSENGYLVVLPDSFARKKKNFSCDIQRGIRPTLNDGLLRIDELRFALEKIKEKEWSNGKIFIMGHSQGAWATAMTPIKDVNGVVLSSLTSCTRRINISTDVKTLRIGYENDWVDPVPVLDCGIQQDLPKLTEVFEKGTEHETFLSKDFRELVLKFLNEN